MDDGKTGYEQVYIDRDGNALGALEWAKLFEDSDYKTIKRTEAHGIVISTVWFGIAPAIFETMVFDGDGDDVWSRSCPKEKAALRYHKEAVSLYLPMSVLKDGEWIRYE